MPIFMRSCASMHARMYVQVCNVSVKVVSARDYIKHCLSPGSRAKSPPFLYPKPEIAREPKEKTCWQGHPLSKKKYVLHMHMHVQYVKVCISKHCSI